MHNGLAFARLTRTKGSASSGRRFLTSAFQLGEDESELYVEEALSRLEEQKQVFPESFVDLLDFCAANKAIKQGRKVDAFITKRGLGSNVLVGNKLVEMYIKCDQGDEAQQAFSRMPNRIPVPWTTTMASLAQNFHFRNAWSIFRNMLLQGVSPDGHTLVTVINVCGNLEDQSASRIVHSIAAEAGKISETFIGTALVSLLQSRAEDSRVVFERIFEKDVRSWNAIMEVYLRKSEFREVIRLFQRMDVEADKVSFVKVLNACTGLGALQDGRAFHEQAIEKGVEGDPQVEAAIFNLYSKCDNLSLVFEYAAHQKSVVLWTRRMAESTKQGDYVKTLKSFQMMQLEGIKADRVSLLTVLDALSDPYFLRQGKIVHSYAQELGFGLLTSLMNAVINMYAKCGSLDDAVTVFEQIHRDLVSWNTLIGAYVQFGYQREAFDLFHQMQLEGIRPDQITLTALLTVCTDPPWIRKGKLIHACFRERGEETSSANAIISMYGRCGSLSAADELFRNILQQNSAAWNSRIAAYGQQGQHRKALCLYYQMLLEGLQPDRVTFLTALSVAVITEASGDIKALHRQIAESGYERETVVGTSLLDTYGKCGRLEEANEVFSKLSGNRNVVSWTAMISAYSQHGRFNEAVQHFRLMQLDGVIPNKVTVAAMLNARSTSAKELSSLKVIYGYCLQTGYERDVVVGNAVLHVHARLGDLETVRLVFSRMANRSVVTWNSAISAYAQAGRGKESARLFQKMQLEHDVDPDKFTLITVLSACSNKDSLKQGRTIHQLAVESGDISDLLVGTAVVHMYSQCGSLEEAEKAFLSIQKPDTVCWNAAIAAFSHYGEYHKALNSFQRMKETGVAADDLTYVALLNACTASSELDLGREIICEAARSGFKTQIASAAINLLGKCGDLEIAGGVFEELPQKSLLVWNGLITAYAQNGDADEALELLRKMQLWGTQPDSVTMVSVLSTLSHSGFVEAACREFRFMKEDFGIQASVSHYGCMIDVLGRVGWLDEAEKLLVSQLPFDADDVLWTNLLASCRIHGDEQRGKRAVQELLELEPRDPTTYVVLSHISCLDDFTL